MNPYPASRGSAFGIRPNTGSATATDPSGTQAQPTTTPAATPNTVVVTPQNAAQYGFDHMGATINTDTGGIVNPFSGPADGQGANRDARNAAVQQRAQQTPNPVGYGYTQIMSDPRARAFNTRLANDTRFAQDVLDYERTNPNHSENYGGNFDPRTPVTPQPTPTGPYANTGIGTRSAPATTPTTAAPSGGTSGNPYPAGSPNAATWDYFNSGGSGTSNTNLAAPETPATGTSSGDNPPWAYSQSGSSGGYRAPTVPPAETASGNVTNAIMRRFNRRNW